MKIIELVSVEKRLLVTLDGLIVSFAYFNWIKKGQCLGFSSKEEAIEFAKSIKGMIPKSYSGARSFKLIERWFVMIGGSHVGSMYDLGEGPISGKGKRKLMLPFPRGIDSLLGLSKEKAEEAAKKLKLYFADILSVKREDRNRSTYDWVK